MKQQKFFRKTGHIVRSILLLMVLLFISQPTLAASNVGDIEYDDNSLTPTEQQSGGIVGHPPETGGWDWGSVGDWLKNILDTVLDGVATAWDAIISFFAEVGQMIQDVWDSMPDWAKDLIITIGLIVAVVIAAVILVVAGVISVVVAVIAVVIAAIAGIIYYAMYGGTDAFNPWHAAAWIFGGALAGGGIALLAEAGLLSAGLGFLWRGITSIAGRIGLKFRGAWLFAVEGWAGEIQAFRMLMGMFNTWVGRKLAWSLFVRGGWSGLLGRLATFGFWNSAIGTSFTFIYGLATGEPATFQQLFASAITGFLGGVTFAGFWNRFMQAGKLGRTLWALAGSGAGGLLAGLNGWISGDGFTWNNVLVGAAAWLAVGPMSVWFSKTSMSNTILEVAFEYPKKIISNRLKDIMLWNDPEAHPDNWLRGIWDGMVNQYNNVLWHLDYVMRNWKEIIIRMTLR